MKKKHYLYFADGRVFISTFHKSLLNNNPKVLGVFKDEDSLKKYLES